MVCVCKMSFWLYVVLFILYINKSKEEREIFHRDFTDECRRRAFPSVFLSRHLVEANSKTLHFSKGILPYNCYISVRTESGNNIIIVIQLPASTNTVPACRANKKQLQVYELGETFGGYWGPMPSIVMRGGKNKTDIVYTLQTSSQTPGSNYTYDEIYIDEVNTTTEIGIPTNDENEEEDKIHVEVPLLNFSLNVDSNAIGENINLDQAFDFLYDVTPKPGVKYETSIIPLVQFNVMKEDTVGDKKSNRRYNLDYRYEGFTHDRRLTLPDFLRRKTTKKNNAFVNHYLNFKRTKHHMTTPARSLTSRFTPLETKEQLKDSDGQTQSLSSPELLTTDFNKLTETSFQKYININEMLKEYRKDFGTTLSEENIGVSENIVKLLNVVSNKNFNASAQLAKYANIREVSMGNPRENIFTYKYSVLDTNLSLTTEIKKIIESSTHESGSSTTPLQDLETDLRTNNFDYVLIKKINRETSRNLNSVALKNVLNTNTYDTTDRKEFIIEVTEPSNVRNDPIPNVSTIPVVTGSMVGHESWENLVQAAPVMADMLNHSVVDKKPWNYLQDTTKKIISNLQKKREIKAIDIDNARPHASLTTDLTSTTKAYAYQLPDIQEFAELMEIQDDEIALGRVALRYIRHYVGSSHFNICEEKAQSRYVFLMNSSRIVLALNNFTMEGMTIVLTTARTLINGEAFCPVNQLECQVSGARVCIDSVSACDGIPNCGSFDVYDEDRLICEKQKDRNVILASATCIIAILTALYIIFYWLKRSVPKVSKAFFIFSEGDENDLYLEPHMRSPGDFDQAKFEYHPMLFYDGSYETSKEKSNKCLRFVNKIRCCILRKKQEKKGDSFNYFDGNFPRDVKRVFSFAQLEINQIIKTNKDVSTQTRPSLETKTLINKRIPRNSDDPSNIFCSASVNENIVQELDLLKFLKNNNSNLSLESSIGIQTEDFGVVPDDEKELYSTLFDHHKNEQISNKKEELQPITSIIQATIHSPPKKQLRFKDGMPSVRSDSYDENLISDIGVTNVNLAQTRGDQDYDKIEEHSETDRLGIRKELKKFWSAGKTRKKKPSNVSKLV